MNIFEACQSGNINRVRELITENIDVNIINENHNSPLYLTCRPSNLSEDEPESLNKIEIVNLLIEHGANVNYINDAQISPLMSACKYGYLEIAKILIQNNANVNHIDNNRSTSLIKATTYGKFLLVKLLLENGANVNHIDRRGISAYIIAQQHEYTNIMELLIQYGAIISNSTVISNSNNSNIETNRTVFSDVNELFENNLGIIKNINITKKIPETFPTYNLSNFVSPLEKLGKRLECPICMSHAVNVRLNPCGHLICSICYDNIITKNELNIPEDKKCPICRESPVNDQNIIYGGYFDKIKKYTIKYINSLRGAMKN